MTTKDPVIDQDRVTALLAVMGRERLGQLLLLFHARVDALRADIESCGPDSNRQRAMAHQSRGSAGSLGLTALAASLSRLEAIIDQPSQGANGCDPSLGSIADAVAELAAQQTEAHAALEERFPGLTPDHEGEAAGALNR